MGRNKSKNKPKRRRDISFFESFPPASRAAEGFTAKYATKNAMGRIYERVCEDTKKKFYEVVLEWEDDGRGRKHGQAKVDTKVDASKSGV